MRKNASASRLLPSRAGRRPARAGFTLMEVNIALLLMAVGLLGLFSLFPVGLRQSDSASSDSTQAAFADLVLNAMRANAQMITNWSDWVVLTNGINLGVAEIDPPAGGKVITVPTVNDPAVRIKGDGSSRKLGNATGDGYLIADHYLEYALHVEDGPAGPNDPVKRAWMQITDRRYTALSRSPIYATAFIYTGM